MKHGKKYAEALKKYDAQKLYSVSEACKVVKDLHFVKFDETVELHVALRLGKSQTIRDTLVFPNQFKAEKKVLVFCKEDRVKEALDAGADIIMLDNMDNDTMRKAVEMIDGKAQTECSGNVTKERLKEIAEIGVDFVSCGALTHSAMIMDVSLKNLKTID